MEEQDSKTQEKKPTRGRPREYTPEELAKRQRENYNLWLKKNREARNKRRREKYKSDAAVREKAKAQAKAYREQRRKNADPRHFMTTADGKKIQYLYIREVSELTGIPSQTLRLLEQKGEIPKPLTVAPRRRYSVQQVEILKEVGEALRKGVEAGLTRSEVLKSFKDDFEELWDKSLGKMMDYPPKKG